MSHQKEETPFPYEFEPMCQCSLVGKMALKLVLILTIRYLMESGYQVG